MSDTLSSAFMDPTTMGLLGLAGGFGQAAMPSRLPIPLGAAMGYGAQGLMQGLQQSQAAQLRQQQIQQAQLANIGQRGMMTGLAARQGFQLPPGVALPTVAQSPGAPFGAPNFAAMSSSPPASGAPGSSVAPVMQSPIGGGTASSSSTPSQPMNASMLSSPYLRSPRT